MVWKRNTIFQNLLADPESCGTRTSKGCLIWNYSCSTPKPGEQGRGHVKAFGKLATVPSKLNTTKTSQYVGVSRSPRITQSGPSPDWVVHVHYNGKSHYLGAFATELDAVAARQQALTDLENMGIGGR